MKEVIGKMQGIFVQYCYPYRNEILSDLRNLEYIGLKNDKMNIRNDVANLLFDIKSSINEASTKLRN
ncbi:hypothetical protein FACS1894199_09700 [Bacteroidia bacterium]|nr:hypothetical protein FACS1894199_09700 [Bacteroidia bacterium]